MTENGFKRIFFFRGLVFWILTSKLFCLCVLVSVCVLYFSLNVMTVF